MKFSSSPKRPESWSEMKIAEVCKTFTSGGTPSRKRPEFYANGSIPWVKTKELNDGVVTEVEEFITADAVKNSSAKLLPKNTVLLAMYGATVGKLGVLGIEAACNQACAAMVPKDGVVDFRFLYYLLMRHRKEIIGQAIGGAQQNLSGELIKGFTFDFPTFQEQQAIANSLWLLDEKIAVNRHVSQTLENIMQTIFKSWFIDFDPVNAKIKGEKPVGINDAVAALFPDSMEESEFGPVPRGWQWGSVGDVAEVIDCLHSKKPDLLSEGQPYLQLDSIHDDGILRFEKTARISGADYEKWTNRIEVNDGDCVITNVGRVGAVSQIPSNFKGAIGRNITAIRPTNIKLHKTFLAVALTSAFMKKEIKTNTDSGTILEALNVRSIPKLRLPIVGTKLFEIFENVCGPMQAQRHVLHRESVKLTELRDALLPRLISGELQIPEEMLVS